MTKWNGLRRTPLKRKTGLDRSKDRAFPRSPIKRKKIGQGIRDGAFSNLTIRKPIPARSKRREAMYAGPNGRRAFVARMLEEFPNCQIGAAECTGRAQSVHEVIKRSAGGAILPGPKAEEQGQRFLTACFICNGYVERFPKWARENGFSISRHSLLKGSAESQ